MNGVANTICDRLSLRSPRRESLEILENLACEAEAVYDEIAQEVIRNIIPPRVASHLKNRIDVL